MTKLIAIESGIETILEILTSDLSSRIKQQALMFESIGILHLNPLLNFAEMAQVDPGEKLAHSIAELRWLSENGIVFEPSIPSDDLERLLITTLGENHALEYRRADNDVISLMGKRKTTPHVEKDKILAMARKDAIILRLLSATMNKMDDITAITTLSETNYDFEVPNAQKSAVIQIVINKLPLPNNMTPWEKIVDYRNDPENQNSLLSLRRWIRKISTEELSRAEINDEIEWQINEFQKHMKYHKIKANSETLEVLVKAPLEIIENLVKLKLSKIPEPFFAIKKRQVTLMDAEIRAPGKELAYLIKTIEAFQPQE